MLTATPNPARDYATFRAPKALNASGNLRLFDAAGNLVRELRFSGTQLSVSLAGMQPGLYFGELAGNAGYARHPPAGCEIVARPTLKRLLCLLLMAAAAHAALPALDFAPAPVFGDSLNCRLVGNWPFGPVLAAVMETGRPYAYTSAGGGVYCLDITDVANPVTLSEAIHTGGNIKGLVFTPFTLFAVTGVLEIFDVSNPALPQRLTAYRTPSIAQGAFANSGLLYVADRDSGLRILDISTPASPNELGHLYLPAKAWNVVVDGAFAYVADGDSGLCIIDVHDPASPQLVGRCDTPGTGKTLAVNDTPGAGRRRSKRSADY